MKYFDKIPGVAQAVLLIIAGIIILLDAMGHATQILHILVLCGAIGLIIGGIIQANVIGKIYSLLKKDR